MQEKIYNTNELYGVFGLNGSFKICYDINPDKDVHCLFNYELPKNTIIQEEIGLYKPLAVYNPYEHDKTKTLYWLDSRFFNYNDKIYKALPLDIIINEYLNFYAENIFEEDIPHLESIIRRLIKKNKNLLDNIFKNMYIGLIPIDYFKKDKDIKLDHMSNTFIGVFNILNDKDYLSSFADEFPDNIMKKSGNNITIYVDRVTKELVIDKYDKDLVLISRLYHNPRSDAKLQIYFMNDTTYYLCGIKKSENEIKKLFDTGLISSRQQTTYKYKKLQRIK